jgi:beta-N-acetylhexosaminidase
VAIARRATITLLALVLGAATLAACGGGGDDGDRASSDDGAAAVTTTTVPCTEAPLAERAAAVLVVGIDDDTTADGPLTKEVLGIGVGGVVIKAPNVVDGAQLTRLVEGLRAGSTRPILVTADEEGGRVSRLKAVVGSTSSARSLGQQTDDAVTAEAARRGALMRSFGIDIVLGPVVDADGGPADGAIGDRSFSGDVAAAGDKAAAFVAGLRQSEVQATIKHFPGQGGVVDDSHLGTVVSHQPRAEVEASARAFLPSVEAGAGAVMVSHVTYESIGPLPASVEPAMYELLRSLGFEGAAMTDALGMGAIVQRWPIPQAAVVALGAGADIVLINQGQEAVGIRDAIVAAVADGSLPEARLDEAVGRMLTLRGDDPRSMTCPGSRP